MIASRLWFAGVLALAACFDEPPAGLDGGATPMDLGSDTTPSQGPALDVRVRRSDDLTLLPSRVIILAVPPTRPLDLHRDGATARILSADALAITDGVLLVTGQALLPLPAGTYDVTFLQGPEYEQVSRRVTIDGKAVVKLDAVLEHSVATPGWLAADMHLHTSRSFDSRLLPAHRVISEVAAGVELLVPTDHVWHNQLQPYVEALGYAERAVSIPGSEYGFRYGHLGVYPVEFDPQGELWGAPSWELYENWGNLTDELVFPMIHGLPGQPLVVINHPRLLPDLGYFIHLGWPHTPDEPLKTAGMFEGLEVLNGYQSGPAELSALLRDWFFLLSGGYRIAGLGNSDTHRMDWLTSGYPRTWLRLITDEPSRLVPNDLRDTLLAMRAVASTGPFLKLRVDGHEIGETFSPPGSTVTVEVEADAASWIDLSRVLIYHNGVMVREFAIVPPRSHPALRQQLTLPVTSDGWIVAMAVGDQPLPTAVIGAVGGGMTRPFAFTNPVWLDFEGDGKVQPPPLLPGPPPMPFGALSLRELETEQQTARVGAAALHAPLDCAPDVYLEWLERTRAAK
jgi:hypothetical protein